MSAVRDDAHGSRASVVEVPSVRELLGAAVHALNGADRPGQLAMAEAVEASIATGEHLLVQAGTGTGKSLGYLVPLLRYAVESGRAAVVSTATLALQNQVVERDLPRLADALHPLLGRRPTMQTVKGRANYVCRHKLAGGFPQDDVLFDLPELAAAGTGPPSSRLEREVTRLREWAEQSATGDRDELTPGVTDRSWRQVSVTAHECLGAQSCPVASACFVERARERARDVDVVVTNHALLAIDAFEGRKVLPEHDLLVVDEAHELADRVTSATSQEISGSIVATAASRARKHGRVDADDLQQAADDLAVVLDELDDGRFAAGVPERLRVALVGVRNATRQAASALKQRPGEKRPGEKQAEAPSESALQVARAAVTEVFEVAERMVAPPETDVLWLSRDRVGFGESRPTLHVAPLSVAGLLRAHLFRERTVVLTSATLALGGSFDGAARQLGLVPAPAPDGDDVAWRGVDVGSPFDYPRQAILYVARRLPPPGRDPVSEAFLDELTALVKAAGGRTLALFSSRRAAEAAAEEMRRRLDVEVLCQGDDATPNLVRRFAAEPATCLFGTLSLWQGVDVPGPSCQLVVIDRLPFPRPDDPLSSARQEAVAKAGGNGFLAVAAQHAALRLAQGAGRLLRSTTDRGVVAVLDSRLVTARYSGYLQASLPPFWRTTDREVVLAALRRLASSS